jgi:hypothetical protein
VSNKEWVTRGGEEVLTRKVSEGPSAWKWTRLPKVMYWREDEVFHEPWNEFAPRTFKRGDTLYAIHPGAYAPFGRTD